ncbi:MAG: hypothetical protein HQ488_03845 [Parcubacteria group bacterium]|nr:hypothetical protein [Parcubacteria group bacterium]
MARPTRPEDKQALVTQEQISVPEQVPESTEAMVATVEQISSTETEVSPETNFETSVQESGQESESVDLLPAVEPVAAPVVATPPPPPEKDRLEKEVEVILEEDLMDLYLKLPVDQQAAFKAKGEETLSKIRVLLNASKINAKKIFSLIGEWLKMIPGVNNFFLAQEAKIKTDKILIVAEEEKKRALDQL